MWECYRESVLQAIPEHVGKPSPGEPGARFGTSLSQTQQVPRSWRSEQSGVSGLGQRQVPEVPAKQLAKPDTWMRWGPTQGLFTGTGPENRVINPGPKRLIRPRGAGRESSRPSTRNCQGPPPRNPCPQPSQHGCQGDPPQVTFCSGRRFP